MKKKIESFFINSLLITFGFAITAFGLILILRSNFGMGPWGALEVGLSSITVFSMGQITQLISLLLIVLSWLMKIKPSLVTFMNMFFIGYFMDLFLIILPKQNYFPFQILFFLSGLLIYSFGIGFYLSFSVRSSGPRESFMLAISRNLKISMRFSRVIIDVSVLILALITKGSIGVGTIIFAFSAGPLIQFFLKLRGFTSEKGTIKRIATNNNP